MSCAQRTTEILPIYPPQAEGDVDAQALDHAVEALPVEENADAFHTPISDAQHGDGIPDNGADTGLASDGIPAPFTADRANSASPIVWSPGRSVLCLAPSFLLVPSVVSP